MNPEGVAVAAFPTPEGETMEEQHDFEPIVKASAWSRLQAVYSDRTYEGARPPFDSDLKQFATIRIGVSTVLVQTELREAMTGAGWVVFVALDVSSAVALLLSQWMLRPIPRFRAA